MHRFLPAFILSLLLASVPALAAITFSQDFDSGALNIADTQIERAETDEPLITLAARRVMASGRWFHFDISGVAGKRPVFQVPLEGNANGAHPDELRYVYSFDGGQSFAYFSDGLRTETHFVFQPDAPFVQDTVRIAYALPYPVSRTLEHTRQVLTSPWAKPVPSADQHGVIALSPGTATGRYRDELRREVPRLPLVGYRITDPSVPDAGKRNVVLTSGTHASEVSANHVLEGKVNFMLSDDPAAAELRRIAVVHVYPQVNPEGRHAGYTRSAPGAPRVNVNRDWKDSPEHGQVALMIEAIVRDTGGKAAVLVDYHSMRRGYVEVWDEPRSSRNHAYYNALKRHLPELGYRRSVNQNNVRQWGARTLGAEVSFTLETAFPPHWTEADYHHIGAASARALLTVVQGMRP